MTQSRLHAVNAWQHGSSLDVLSPGESPAPGVETFSDVGAPPGQATSSSATAEAEIEAHLEQIVRNEIGDRPVQVECRVLRGLPGHALTMEAARIGASLVVAGARGGGGALRRLLGSVSRQLTECPAQAVAIVPDDASDDFRPDWRVVVGVDGSSGASRALRWAAKIAQQGSAEVVAVHAFESPVSDASPRELASLATEERLRFEEEWCAPLHIAGVRHRTMFGDGPAADVLRAVGEAERPACVVVGSRGLGWISQRLLGSVSNDLVGDLECTVVIVPAPRDCVVWTP